MKTTVKFGIFILVLYNLAVREFACFLIHRVFSIAIEALHSTFRFGVIIVVNIRPHAVFDVVFVS